MCEINEDDIPAEHEWPKIQLTDFGVSVEFQAEWNNPKDFAGRGTPGYLAPEQYRQINRDTTRFPEQQITNKTNV